MVSAAEKLFTSLKHNQIYKKTSEHYGGENEAKKKTTYCFVHLCVNMLKWRSYLVTNGLTLQLETLQDYRYISQRSCNCVFTGKTNSVTRSFGSSWAHFVGGPTVIGSCMCHRGAFGADGLCQFKYLILKLYFVVGLASHFL